MKSFLISLSILAIAGGAIAAGAPVNETNSSAILAGTGQPADTPWSLSGTASLIAAEKENALLLNQVLTKLNGTVTTSFANSALVFSAPSGDSNSNIQPSYGALSGTGCSLYKTNTGAFFGYLVKGPPGSYVQAIDSGSVPPPGTQLLQGAQRSGQGLYGTAFPSLPIPASGWLEYKPPWGGYLVNGLVICVSSNADPTIVTPVTSGFDAAAWLL